MSIPSLNRYDPAVEQAKKAQNIVKGVQEVLERAKKPVDDHNANPRKVNNRIGFDTQVSPRENGIQLFLAVNNTLRDGTNMTHQVVMENDSLQIVAAGMIKGEETSISRQINLGKLNDEQAVERILSDLSRNEPEITGYLIEKAQEEMKLEANPALKREQEERKAIASFKKATTPSLYNKSLEIIGVKRPGPVTKPPEFGGPRT